MCVGGDGSQIQGNLSGRVSSCELSSDVCMGENSPSWGDCRLFEVSSDVCMGEGSQIQEGCRAGCCLRGRLMLSWWCVLESVGRFFGFVLGGNRFLQ